jgi:arylamine N-acetyltransferase
MKTPELELLQILGLQPEKPSQDFLARLLKHHQRHVPYENVSKLVRGQSGNFALPGFEEYVQGIQGFDCGGTCFTQNVHFQHLLGYLGFESTLLGKPVDGVLNHPNLRVRLDGKNYFVDLGIMSSFVGPFELDPQQVITQQIGDQTYKLTPAADRKSGKLEIFRKGSLIREIHTSEPAPTTAQISDGLSRTFGKEELFMKNLVVHKSFGEFSRGLWNRSFYVDQGTTHTVTEIKTEADLQKAFELLEMPRAPWKEALEVLRTNEIGLF